MVATTTQMVTALPTTTPAAVAPLILLLMETSTKNKWRRTMIVSTGMGWMVLVCWWWMVGRFWIPILAWFSEDFLGLALRWPTNEWKKAFPNLELCLYFIEIVTGLPGKAFLRGWRLGIRGPRFPGKFTDCSTPTYALFAQTVMEPLRRYEVINSPPTLLSINSFHSISALPWVCPLSNNSHLACVLSVHQSWCLSLS